MKLYYTARNEEESNPLGSNLVLKPSDNATLNPVKKTQFLPAEGDPKGLFAMLQYLSLDGLPMTIKGAQHSPELSVDHSDENTESVGSPMHDGELNSEAVQQKLEFAKQLIASIKQKKTESKEYVYDPADREFFVLVKQIYSTIVSARTELGIKYISEGKPNEAFAEFESINKEFKSLNAAFSELQPKPYEEILNLAAIGYEGMYKILWQALGDDIETRIQNATNVKKRLNDGTALRKNSIEMYDIISDVESIGIDCARKSFGDKKEGREVYMGQVGFTDGEAMGASYLHDGIALIIRNTKEVRNADGEITAKKGALAMTVLDEAYSSPEFIEAFFQKFLEHNPGIELKDLQISMIGGKSNQEFKNYNPNGLGLPDIRNMSEAQINEFIKQAGKDVLTALRIVDYATDNQIPFGNNYLFREEQPAAFVASSGKYGLEVEFGRAETTRPYPEAAHLITRFRLNDGLANVAFENANDGYLPLLITRSHFSDAMDVYYASHGFGTMDSIFTSDAKDGINRGSTQRFCLNGFAVSFEHFMKREIVDPLVQPIFARLDKAVDSVTITAQSRSNNRQKLLGTLFSGIGITVSGLGDSNKISHKPVADITAPAVKGFRPAASHKARKGSTAELKLFEVKFADGKKNLEWSSAFASRFSNACIAVEDSALAHTIGPATEEYHAKLAGRGMPTEARRVSAAR